MSYELVARVKGLAGICQAAYWVNRLANSGAVEPYALETAVTCVTELNPKHLDEAVGDIRRGLRVFIDLLYPQNDRDPVITRYLGQIISVRSQLAKSDTLIQIIQMRLRQIAAEDADLDIKVGQLSALYKDTISTLPQRIQVPGKPTYLKDVIIQAKLRTLLFYGIRCAWLWHQFGGRGHNFLFQRSAMANTARELLKTL
ncbi:MAG: DUF489 family protein [Gammaproteobacteria bacterium]|nr:MAG: DUF489 family protein [Gammaproteobacteria bacterium]